MSKQKIGINLMSLRADKNVGVEQFFRHIVAAMPIFGRCKIAISKGFSINKLLGEDFIATSHTPETVVFPRVMTTLRIVFEMLVLPFFFYNCEKVLSINNFGPMFGCKKQQRIIIIHDVWFFSEYYEGGKLYSWIFGFLLRLQLKTTDKVITVSEFSKNEIHKYLGVEKGKIEVVTNCASGIDIRTNNLEQKENDYFLLIGSDRKNKNVSRAIEGYQKYCQQNKKPLKLTVVGSYTKEFEKSVLSRKETQQINWLGYVTREELNDQISKSRGVVFLSLYEGFGIPVIEAIAAGKPVLVSTNTVCQELAKQSCIAVDGKNISHIAHGFKAFEDFDLTKVDTTILELYNCECSANKLQQAIMQDTTIKS